MKRFQQLIRDVAPDRGPYHAFPDSAAAEVARQCSPADIAEIIAEIENLSAEKNALPDWDGDAQDMVARAQELLAGILAAAPARLLPAITKGLMSQDELARQYVGIALEQRKANGTANS